MMTLIPSDAELENTLLPLASAVTNAKVGLSDADLIMSFFVSEECALKTRAVILKHTNVYEDYLFSCHGLKCTGIPLIHDAISQQCQSLVENILYRNPLQITSSWACGILHYRLYVT